MKILGIETSCDETSASVVENGRIILSNVISSQIDIHKKFGGVVPEVASRKHVEFIIPVIQEALDSANCTLDDIEAISVINRPGLIGALIVGVASGKTIAYSAGIPLVPVHHLEAHIYANWLSGEEIDFPLVCLVVSGGHSDIIYMKGHGDYEIIARTKDDAAGEAFDKCARAMGLGYPGGPIVDKLSKDGRDNAIKFPRAKVGDSLNFSFSGLKTAVIRYSQNMEQGIILADVAASFQKAIVDVLVDNTFAVALDKDVKHVLAAGGVAANTCLQESMRKRGDATNIKVSIPESILCTDNAAMVACAGYYAYNNGIIGDLDLDCFASEPLAKK